MKFVDEGIMEWSCFAASGAGGLKLIKSSVYLKTYQELSQNDVYLWSKIQKGEGWINRVAKTNTQTKWQYFTTASKPWFHL